MPSYPLPEENPVCQCKDNAMKAFFCPYGHMLECHYPYNCSKAGCTHLHRYDYTPQEVERLDTIARKAIELGMLPPYQMGQHGEALTERNTP